MVIINKLGYYIVDIQIKGTVPQAISKVPGCVCRTNRFFNLTHVNRLIAVILARLVVVESTMFGAGNIFYWHRPQAIQPEKSIIQQNNSDQ